MSTDFVNTAIADLKEDQENDVNVLEAIRYAPGTVTITVEGIAYGAMQRTTLTPDYFINVISHFLAMRTAARADKIERAEHALTTVGALLDRKIKVKELRIPAEPDVQAAPAPESQSSAP